MPNFFLNIYKFLLGRKILGGIFLFIYAALCTIVALQINFEEDITKLIPTGDDQEILKRVLQETSFKDKIILTISAENENNEPDSLVAYANELTESFDAEFSEYIREVQGKIADREINTVYNFVYDHLPVFLNEADFDIISQKIERDSIQSEISSGYRQLMAPTGIVTKNYFFKDPLGFTGLGLNKLRELQVGENFSIYRNYLITKDRQHIIIFIDPNISAAETGKNEKFITLLDQKIAELDRKHPGIKAEYFGGVLYALANANRIKSDINKTLGIALGLLLILLLYVYRKPLVPVILFLPTLFGGLTGLAVLSIFKENVSAISLGIGAVLLGVTLDYALHILTHYRNNQNPHLLFKEISKPVLMSSITTAIAFLCLTFVNSEALLDLGIFAAVSVFFSAIFALILVPWLYNPKISLLTRETFIDRFAAIDFSKYKFLVYGILVIFVISLFFFQKVKFNEDLNNLNYQPEKIVQKEKRIEGIAGQTGKNIYLATYGRNLDEALQINNQLYTQLKELEQRDEINSFSSVGGVILSNVTQNSRIERWKEYWSVEKQDNLKTNLIETSSHYSFKPESFNQFYEQLQKDFSSIGLQEYNAAGAFYLDDFISESEDFAVVSSSVNIPETNSEKIFEKFKDQEGILVLDRKALNESFLSQLKDNFNNLIYISILAVFLILLISYRNIELSLFTILPIGITWFTALGIMAIFEIQFNVLNIIICTFIFGLGLDYSIFVTNSFLKEYETGKKDLKTYQTSILISVITTLLGMGALIFARHPALKSISIVSIIGILTAVLVSFTLQGFLFRKLVFDRIALGKKVYSFQLLKGFRKEPKTETLYNKKKVYNDYRYKSVFGKIKKAFKIQQERYLKLSSFLKEEENVAILNSKCGLLAIFLYYKFRNMEITGYEHDREDLRIARQIAKTKKPNLNFTSKLKDIKSSEVFIVHGHFDSLDELKDAISKTAKKVIFLESDSNSRWLLDLNFELEYRQNKLLVYAKMT
ncbi:MMPL family transporter [Gramella sp. AN32]|uniref:MMPL family transporter n=1 Tax=Christiangramia antarctica TaxID=2058158 RepID=A0ABW5WXZ5_9FLAO|nr:MMPL family transporter [Gramella sp. AN32]MCM4156767.1 hypothetical protein [Gramella sp. AN32]